jgi:hypothetical protein
MDQLFPVPEVTQTEVKSKSPFDSLFSDINSRRLEYGTPKISQLGLGPSTSQTQTLSPLKTKPSIGDLFEDTQGLFDNDEDDGKENNSQQNIHTHPYPDIIDSNRSNVIVRPTNDATLITFNDK